MEREFRFCTSKTTNKERRPALLPIIFKAIFLLIISAAPCFAADPVIIDETLRIKNIGNNIEYFLDENRSLGIDDVLSLQKNGKIRWLRSDPSGLRLGFVKAAVWVRLSTVNTSTKDIEWLLQQDFFSITRISFYQVRNMVATRSESTGLMFKYDERPFNDPTFVFPVKLKAKESADFYLQFINKFPTSIIMRAASLGAFYEEKNKWVPFLFMLYGFFIVMIGYNFILYFSMRDRSYLYYTIFIAVFITYFMHYNGHMEQYLWGNIPLWSSNVGYFFISLIVASVYQFVRHFFSLWELSKSFDRQFKCIVVANVIAAVLSLFLNQYVLFGYLLIAIAVLSLIYGFSYVVYISIVKKFRQARIFLLSSALLFFSAMIFALKALALIPETFISAHIILIGGAFQVIILSIGLADKINIMKTIIRKAEVSYRHLVESSTDVIFLLDKDLRILSMNNAVEKHLGYKVIELIGSNFLDLIQDTWGERTAVTRKLVEEQLADLNKTKTSIQFRTTLKTRYGSEPEDFAVKLEYAETGEAGYDFLGKASPVSDDTMLKFLIIEHYMYSVDNYLNNADMMSMRLTRNLPRYLPQSEIPMIRIAIREILINAIEHGNLGISFDEKTRALDDDAYIELVHRLQKDPRLSDRKVTIDYTLDDEKVVYRISDEGEGFDHPEIFSRDPMNENKKMLAHGRGLFIVRNEFDSIQFNEKGNAVTLIKYFKRL
jgi:two-component system, sensor histidine kinase LadS